MFFRCFPQDKLKALHEAEHQRLDVEIAAMETDLAKNVVDQAEKEVDITKTNDLPGATKEGEGESVKVVTTTVIEKPDWGEADVMAEPAVSKENTDTNKEKDEEKDASE